METFLIKTVQLLLSLSILVIFHEFGHFIFARMFKVRVENSICFSIRGFLFSNSNLKNSYTEYGIGWLPFGGYVKISGMIDESMDRTNEPAAQTVGISVETGMAKAPNYGSGRCI